MHNVKVNADLQPNPILDWPQRVQVVLAQALLHAMGRVWTR